MLCHYRGKKKTIVVVEQPGELLAQLEIYVAMRANELRQTLSMLQFHVFYIK
jgi:hypothetical protein